MLEMPLHSAGCSYLSCYPAGTDTEDTRGALFGLRLQRDEGHCQGSQDPEPDCLSHPQQRQGSLVKVKNSSFNNSIDDSNEN